MESYLKVKKSSGLIKIGSLSNHTYLYVLTFSDFSSPSTKLVVTFCWINSQNFSSHFVKCIMAQWLAHLIGNQKVDGSNPSPPNKVSFLKKVSKSQK